MNTFIRWTFALSMVCGIESLSFAAGCGDPIINGNPGPFGFQVIVPAGTGLAVSLPTVDKCEIQTGWEFVAQDAQTGQEIGRSEGSGIGLGGPGAGSVYAVFWSHQNVGLYGIGFIGAVAPTTNLDLPAECTVGTQFTADASGSVNNNPNPGQLPILYDWKVVTPSGSELVLAPSGANKYSFTPGTEGTYSISAKAGYFGPFGPNGQIMTKTVECSRAYSLSLAGAEIAQTTFLPSSGASLVQGKPTMARVIVSSPDANSISPADNSLIGVKGIFQAQDGQYEVVGCIRAGDLANTTLSPVANLFKRVDVPGEFALSNGTFNVLVNPDGGVSGIPKGAGCGELASNSVSKKKGNTPSLAQPISYNSRPSPEMSFVFTKVNLPCIVGPECQPLFSEVSQDSFAQSVNRSEAAVKALFPVSPSPSRFKLSTQTGVPGAGGRRARLQKKIGDICGSSNPKCVRDAAEIYDFQAVRSAGLLKDSRSLARYIGIVSRSIGYAPNPNPETGYFDYMRCLEGDGICTDPGQLGLTRDDVPQTSLAIEGAPFTVAHELTHTYGLRYPEGSANDHQSGEITSSGFWVNFYEDFSSVGSVLRSQGLILGRPNYMREGGGEPPWPPASSTAFWSDDFTYRKLQEKIPCENCSKIYVRREPEDQFLFSAIVDASGRVFVGDVYQDVSPGYTSGSSSNFAQIQVADVSGNTLTTLATPYTFNVIDGGPNGSTRVSQLGAISTGIPKLPNGVSVTVSAGARHLTKFFPSIEVLRTAVSNVPNEAFLIPPNEGEDQLRAILNEAERSMEDRDVAGAARVIQGRFIAKAIQIMAQGSDDSSSVDVNLNKIVHLANSVSASLSEIGVAVPPLSNSLIRIQPQAGGFQSGAKGSFAIYREVELNLPDEEFYLEVILNGTAQKVEAFDGSKWRFLTPRLTIGSYDARFKVFKQSKRKTGAVTAALARLEMLELEIRRRLREETDPEIRAQLDSEIERILVKASALKEQLSRLRMLLGPELVYAFSVD